MDEISLVIGASFGGFILLLIVGFFLLQHRNRNATESSSAYGTRDYSQYKPRRQPPESKYSYDTSRRPFKSDAEIEANARRVRTNTRAIVLAIIIVAIVAVIIASVFFSYYNFILLIFLIPIAISFLRTRRDRNPDQDQDRDRRY